MLLGLEGKYKAVKAKGKMLQPSVYPISCTHTHTHTPSFKQGLFPVDFSLKAKKKS